MAHCENCGSNGIRKLAHTFVDGVTGLCKPCAGLLRRMEEGDWEP